MFFPTVVITRNRAINMFNSEVYLFATISLKETYYIRNPNLDFEMLACLLPVTSNYSIATHILTLHRTALEQWFTNFASMTILSSHTGKKSRKPIRSQLYFCVQLNDKTHYDKKNTIISEPL